MAALAAAQVFMRNLSKTQGHACDWRLDGNDGNDGLGGRLSGSGDCHRRMRTWTQEPTAHMTKLYVAVDTCSSSFGHRQHGGSRAAKLPQWVQHSVRDPVSQNKKDTGHQPPASTSTSTYTCTAHAQHTHSIMWYILNHVQTAKTSKNFKVESV